jgi:hypothetical protein
MKTLKNYIDSVVNKVLRESLEERADEIINKLKSNVNEEDDMDGFEELEFDEEYMNESECSECGGMMREGECSECGYKMEGLYEESDPNSEKCKYHKEKFGPEDERTIRFCGTEKSETKEGKKFPDLSGDGKVTRKDVLMGRGVKLNGNKTKKHQTDEEMEEGNAFTGALAKAKSKGDDEFEVEGKKYQVKESIKLTEEEMIDLIERIVNEEKDNIRKQSNPPGVSTTKRNLDKSKKENDDYIKSVTKKMKDYLKDGSKGDFSFEPKVFPKGNGELGEMDKKTYKATKEVDEYIDNFSSAGQENLVYDEIHPDEDWVSDNVEGSSRTGNNPKWANAVETDANKKVNDRRKKNLLGYLKKKEAYNKSPQPVYMVDKEEGKSAREAEKIMTKLESTEEKKEKLIKEDINKMNRLLGYNKKTQ